MNIIVIPNIMQTYSYKIVSLNYDTVQPPERISGPSESQFKPLLLLPGWTPLRSQPWKSILESLLARYLQEVCGTWTWTCIYISITIFTRLFNKNYWNTRETRDWCFWNLGDLTHFSTSLAISGGATAVERTGELRKLKCTAGSWARLFFVRFLLPEQQQVFLQLIHALYQIERAWIFELL